MEVDKHEDNAKEEGELSDDEEIISLGGNPALDCDTSERRTLMCRTPSIRRSSRPDWGASRIVTPRYRRCRRPRNRYTDNNYTNRANKRPVEEKNIPSLLALPPPPPPPPLPSVPPPEQPEPPPLHLPPETPRQRKRKVAPIKFKVKRSSNTFCSKSPPAGDIEDPDYIDLLLEYQQIQKQLAKLAHSEKQGAIPSEPVTGSENEESHQNTENSKSGTQADDLVTDQKDKDTNTCSPTDSDELDIQRLRDDALKSVSSEANKKTANIRKDPAHLRKEPPRKLPFAPSSLRYIGSRRHSAKRRSVGVLNRRSHQLHRESRKDYDCELNRRHYEDRGRQCREDDRHSYDKQRQREQYYINQRRIDVQKILTLDDPDEQYRKFMELVAGVKEDQQVVSDGLARDNYEPVEMDLDSEGEQSPEVSSVQVNRNLTSLDIPLPPATYPTTMVPDGLALPSYFTDVDYRPLFDRNVLHSLPNMPHSTAHPAYGNISDENLFMGATGSTVIQHMPRMTDASEERILKDVDSEYGSDMSKRFQSSGPVDVVSDSAADDEMVNDGENEEAILRAKLLQSLNAKKKPAVKMSDGGTSNEIGVSSLKETTFSESDHQSQNDACTTKPNNEKAPVIEVEQSSGQQIGDHDQRASKENSVLTQEEAKLALRHSDSPTRRLTPNSSCNTLSQLTETDGSGAGSPYSSQDNLEASRDPEMSDTSHRWRMDYTSKHSRSSYYRHHKSYYKVPQHKPVVISLAEDSESDDEKFSFQQNVEGLQSSVPSVESDRAQGTANTGNLNTSSMSLPGNLDTFLKEARMSVEVKISSANTDNRLPEQGGDMTDRLAVEENSEDVACDNNDENKKLLIVEAELDKHRCLLREKQTSLERIKKQIAKKKSVLCLVEQHVKKLREQLAESEKIVKTNRLQLLKFNEEAQDAQSVVDEKRARVQALEAQLDRLGRKVYGDNYKPAVADVTDRSLKVTISKGSQASRQVMLPQKADGMQKTSGIKRTVTLSNKGTTKCVAKTSLKTVTSLTGQQAGVKPSKKKSQQLDTKEQSTAAGLKHVDTGAAGLKNVETGTAGIQNTEQGSLVMKHVVTTSNVLKKEGQTNVSKMSEIAKEKARLMMLEKKYAEMIRKHKDAQSKKGLTAVPAKKLKLTPIRHLAGLTSAGKNGKLSVRSVQVARIQPSLKNVDVGADMQKDRDVDPGCENQEAEMNSDASHDKNEHHVMKAGECLMTDRVTNVLSGHDVSGVAYESGKSLVGMSPYCNKFNALGPFLPKACQIPLDVASSNIMAPDSRLDNTTSSAAYQSSLLQFHSYRLCPYFRLKSGRSLTSLTYSHKLNNTKVLCQYDLMGTCSDDRCQHQHKVDYELSDDELLKELASYCPSLYSGQPGTSTQSDLDNFISDFKKSNGKLTAEEQCLLLISQVSDALKKAGESSVVSQQRHWRPSVNTRLQTDELNVDTKNDSSSLTGHASGSAMTSDLTWSEPDVRYWCANKTGGHETAAASESTDINMWISMAYHKLNQNKKRELGINDALSVLAKGLESNRSASTLWIHYLDLYEQKQDTTAIVKLYRQAIKYSPCFEIYWKYILRSKSFTECSSLCQNALDYLTSCDVKQMSDAAAKKHSHHLLQILVYKAMLYFNIGRFGQAVELIQNALTSSKDDLSKMRNCLSTEDRVLLHLLHGYMVVTEMFPYWVYSPAGTPKYWLVNKDLLLTNIPWCDVLTDPTPEVRDKKVKSALASISDAIKILADMGDPSDCNSVKATLSHLHRNWIEINLTVFSDLSDLLKELNKAEYRALLDSTLWCSVLIETLCRAQQQHDYTITVQQINMLQEEALKSSCCTARLYLALADLRFIMGSSDEALVLMEECAISMFDCDVSKTNESDPNLLYNKLLGLSLPLSYTGPPCKSHVTKDWLQQQVPYLWQCYCFLLDLQGFIEETAETYEAAILSVRETTPLTQLWIRYLHQQMRLVHHTEKSVKAEVYVQFTSLVYRCLNMLQSRIEVPYWSEQIWLDYEPHNAVVSLYLDTCPGDEHPMLAIYERLVKSMPQNVDLLVRTIRYMRSRGHHSLAIGYSMTGLDDLPHSRQLWMIYITLLKEELKQGKICPDQWALYEWSQGRRGHLQDVFDRCTLDDGELVRLTGVQLQKVHKTKQVKYGKHTA